MINHPLIQSLRSFTGNGRACVYTEPLWGVAYNLFIPYASLYMLAFGLTDQQIGLIASISMVVQTVAAFIGGAVTDKIGRRLTTFLVDVVAWATPALIWSISQNFTYFVIAAVLNSLFRVAHTAWTCLMVEDTDPEQLVDMYSWISIFATTSALVSPLTGWLISLYGLVPAMRIAYFAGFLLFVIKLIVLFVFSKETKHGKVRMAETKNQSFLSMLSEYPRVFRDLIRTPQTLCTLGLVSVMSITSLISSTFWSIIAVEKIQVSEAYISVFAFIRSVIMLVFFFGILPRIKHLHFRLPLLAGYLIFIAAQVILILTPVNNYIMLLVSVVLDAACVAMVSPQVDKLTVVTVDPEERARIMALVFSITLIISSPFGWIAGSLSQMDRSYPFMLSIGLYALGFVLTILAGRLAQKPNIAA